MHKGNYTVELKTNEKYQHIKERKERSLTFSLNSANLFEQGCLHFIWSQFPYFKSGDNDAF